MIMSSYTPSPDKNNGCKKLWNLSYDKQRTVIQAPINLYASGDNPVGGSV